MNNQLTIADAGDFCTLAYAAELAGCSIRTVNRAVGAGQLQSRTPRLASKESRSFRGLLLVTDVDAWVNARKAVGK